jgi:hypothetical protein
VTLIVLAARTWCRMWLTGPLRAADLLHLIRVGDLEVALIRYRRDRP